MTVEVGALVTVLGLILSAATFFGLRGRQQHQDGHNEGAHRAATDARLVALERRQDDQGAEMGKMRDRIHDHANRIQASDTSFAVLRTLIEAMKEKVEEIAADVRAVREKS